MNIWLTIIGMALVTYGTRLLPLTTLNEEALPTWARRSLVYVPVAVLSAIVGPEYLPSADWLSFTVDARLPAGLLAILIAWYTRSTILTILIGMVVLLLLT
jgi:branched-subunit amino acid transport protein